MTTYKVPVFDMTSIISYFPTLLDDTIMNYIMFLIHNYYNGIFSDTYLNLRLHGVIFRPFFWLCRQNNL